LLHALPVHQLSTERFNLDLVVHLPLRMIYVVEVALVSMFLLAEISMASWIVQKTQTWWVTAPLFVVWNYRAIWHDLQKELTIETCGFELHSNVPSSLRADYFGNHHTATTFCFESTLLCQP
jgi:hypothetical protein